MERFPLDTHFFLWWLDDDPQLGERARSFFGDERNDVYVSAATAWEISINRDPFDRMLVTQSHVEGVALLTPDTAVASHAGTVRLV